MNLEYTYYVFMYVRIYLSYICNSIFLDFDTIHTYIVHSTYMCKISGRQAGTIMQDFMTSTSL